MALRSLYRRQQSRSVFPKGTWCAHLEVSTTSGSKVMAQKVIFENSPFVPLQDWCKFWSDMFINSRDIAHWNMEKLPMLYNGNFRCHGNVCYVFRISPIFVSIMCVNFGKNRLNIDDFRSRFPFFINQPYHIDSIQNSENFQMTLTFDLYLTLTLSLTFDLDDLKKYIQKRSDNFSLFLVYSFFGMILINCQEMDFIECIVKTRIWLSRPKGYF